MRKLQLFGEMRVEFSRTSTKASAEFDRIQGWGRMKKKEPRGINLSNQTEPSSSSATTGAPPFRAREPHH